MLTCASRFVPFVRLWDSVAALSLLARGSSRVDRESSKLQNLSLCVRASLTQPTTASSASRVRVLQNYQWRSRRCRRPSRRSTLSRRSTASLNHAGAQRELLTRTPCVGGARCGVPDPDGSLRTAICSVRPSWNRRTILPRQRSIVSLVRGEVHRVARGEVDKRHERPCRVLGIHRITRGRTYRVYFRRAASLHERRSLRRAQRRQ